MSILLLGIGNRWAADDGVGPEVVERVQRRWQSECAGATRPVAFKIMDRPDLSLLDLLPGYEQVIIVDAVVGNAPPGTLHHAVWQEELLADRGVERTSSHGFGVRELLGMAARLGKLPPRVELWGIEIASTAQGEGLSPEVAASVPALALALWERLRAA